jgi:hypothetical protein
MRSVYKTGTIHQIMHCGWREDASCSATCDGSSTKTPRHSDAPKHGKAKFIEYLPSSNAVASLSGEICACRPLEFELHGVVDLAWVLKMTVCCRFGNALT